jgi:hypothetical protein
MSIRHSARSALLVAPLVLGVVPAHAATAPGPDSAIRSFTFSSDCTEIPGRLHVREERTGPRRFTAELHGTGLPTGLDRAAIFWNDPDTGEPQEEPFETDRSAHRVSGRTSVPAPIATTHVDGWVRDNQGEESCKVSGIVDPEYISAGSNSVTVSAIAFDSYVRVGVDHVRCRRSETPSGRIVIQRGDRTIRARLASVGCEDGWVKEMHHRLIGPELPSAVRAVVHVGGRAWHAAYRIEHQGAG